VEAVSRKRRFQTAGQCKDEKSYFPGYHMNKKHWITICLDGSVPIEEIFCRLDESFAFAAK